MSNSTRSARRAAASQRKKVETPTARVMDPMTAQNNGVGLVVTPASQWFETFTLKLPSGRVAELRQVDFPFYAAHHQLPNQMLGTVEKVFEVVREAVKLEVADDAAEAELASRLEGGEELGSVVKNMAEQRTLLEDYARLAFVNPKVVVNVTDPETQVAAEYMAIEDLEFVFTWMWRPILYLRLFREQQTAGLRAVASVQDREKVTKRTNRSRKSVPEGSGGTESPASDAV